MKNIEIQVAIWKEGRHYVAQCLDVDISSFGSTEVKALANLKEAVELSFEGKRVRRPIKAIKPNLVSLQLACA